MDSVHKTINSTYNIHTIWEYNEYCNNFLFQEVEDTDRTNHEAYSTEFDYDECKLNSNLLQTNIDKKDKLEIFPSEIIKVTKNAVKQNIYFTCEGLHPPKLSPYGFDAGIDLSLQEKK